MNCKENDGTGMLFNWCKRLSNHLLHYIACMFNFYSVHNYVLTIIWILRHFLFYYLFKLKAGFVSNVFYYIKYTLCLKIIIDCRFSLLSGVVLDIICIIIVVE